MVIRKRGRRWILYTKDGKRQLGIFLSRAAALRRERQIIYFKHRNAGRIHRKSKTGKTIK